MQFIHATAESRYTSQIQEPSDIVCKLQLATEVPMTIILRKHVERTKGYVPKYGISELICGLYMDNI